jgi:hypothetical protein
MKIIEIAGKEYELKFTINVLCEMSPKYDVLNGLNHVDMITIRDLFYYALKGGNKKITQAQAGDLMDSYIQEGGTFDGLIEIVMDELARSLGTKKEEDKSEGEDEGLNQ